MYEKKKSFKCMKKRRALNVWKKKSFKCMKKEEIKDNENES